jgi:radical SAM superfamily enzyme YgiQ (UPF0313 family)
MKILLIRPPVPAHTIGLKHVMICEPLELEYIAAGLPGHTVEIFDMILEKNLKRRLDHFKPDLVGTSCYITGVNEAIKICRQVKRWNRACITIAGGVHAAVAPEDFSDPAIDAICLVDGSSAAPDIVEALEKNRPLEGVPGLAIPTGDGAVRRTPSRPYMPPPDTLPFPRRDLVRHLAHRYYYLFHQPVSIMKTTWGCWHECDFCMTWHVTEGTPFSRSARSIADELQQIETEEVYIVDDIFLHSPERLREIARLIRERNIRKHFLVYGRADFISENEALVKEWADIGLTAVIVGLEAATDAQLQTLNKTCRADQNRKAVEVLQRNGVDIYASLITRPEYTREDWRRLWNYIRELGLYYVNISPLTPLPGSVTWEQFKGRITVDRRAAGLFDLVHCVLPTRMPLRAYYRSLLWVYARTVLNMRRAGRLTLRTRPPVWSAKYMRLWAGSARIFIQFISARRHHSRRQLAKAMDRGPSVPGLGFATRNSMKE